MTAKAGFVRSVTTPYRPMKKFVRIASRSPRKNPTMANLRTSPNEVEVVACKRIEPEFTHWQIAVANAKRDSMRRMKERVEAERMLVAGGYVMAWDADRFQGEYAYAD